MNHCVAPRPVKYIIQQNTETQVSTRLVQQIQLNNSLQKVTIFTFGQEGASSISLRIKFLYDISFQSFAESFFIQRFPLLLSPSFLPCVWHSKSQPDSFSSLGYNREQSVKFRRTKSAKKWTRNKVARYLYNELLQAFLLSKY